MAIVLVRSSVSMVREGAVHMIGSTVMGHPVIGCSLSSVQARVFLR